MADEMMLMLNDDGVAHIYDETYDIVIHCESAEKQKEVEKRLMGMDWIPCSERLPEEYGEYRITWTTSASKKRFIGDSEFEVTSEWDAERYRFKGEWLLDEYIKNYPDVKVIAWKPLEEPWKGEQP